MTILGSRVDLVSRAAAVDQLERWVQSGPAAGNCRQVVVSGYHGLWEGTRDPDVRAALNDTDLWVPDGIAPVLIGRLRGCGPSERVPGAELMRGFLERANEHGYRSFFYGDSEATLGALRNAVERDYPGHEVAGAISPPFRELTEEEDERYIQQINEARPDVLWVGLGLPKQERWIRERRHRLNVPVAVGVGAAFGFLSGRVKRAPPWMGRLGLEWAYRLAREPRKCWRRSLVEGPKFIGCVLLEQFGLRRFD